VHSGGVRRLAVLVAVVALAAGACGNGVSPPRADVPTTAVGVGHLKLVGQPTPADVALQFEIEAPHCIEDAQSVVQGVDVNETTDAVTVTAHVAANPSLGDCAQGEELLVRVPAALKAPLGARHILDGSCAPPAEVLRENETREPCTPTEQQKAEQEAVGTWAEFDAGPLSPRGEPKGAWDGKELIVVGGLALEQYRALNDGAAYNPKTAKWRRIPDLPITGRVHAVAATDDGLLALSHPGTDLSVFDGTVAHVYSATTNAWREVPPPKVLTYPHAMWTGKEDIVWGAQGGIIFDPATNAWRDIPPVSYPGAATSGLASGGISQWIAQPGVLAVQGDYDPRNGSAQKGALFLFDPATNKWRKAADPPGSLQGFGSFTVGSVEVFDNYDQQGRPGIAYDAKTDQWREVDNLTGTRDGGTAYFTGVDLGDGRGVVRVGDSVRPLQMLDKDGHWSHAASPGRMPAPDGVMVWIGDKVLMWGRPAEAHAGDVNQARSWTPPKT
jgi:hypothetical protein